MSTPLANGVRLAGRPVVLAALILGAALATWIVTVQQMDGMDAGPGTDLGGLAWYVGIWTTMMAAMMLPSVAPMALLYADFSRRRAGSGHRSAPTWVFLCGYLLVWIVFGLAAYGIYRLVVWLDPGFLAWDAEGPIVAGVAIAAAGLYQLTPLKDTCLRHCRGPIHFLVHDWRDGPAGAVRLGVSHGLYCVGCCWGLIVVLFALGVMSLLWMAIVAGVIFVEKVLPYGDRLTRPLGVALVALGIWVAVAPGSVPGLTEPSGGMMPMGEQMEEPMSP